MIYTIHVTEQQLRVIIVMIVAALTEQQLRDECSGTPYVYNGIMIVR